MEKFFDNKFFTGINYWDSAHATRMWQEFDETVIDADMQVLRSAGVNSLRIFPLWSDFQPLTGGNAADRVYEFMLDGEPLPDTEAGRAGVSEEMCRRFERFCALAEKHDLKLIVGLITGQMSFGGFYPPVFGGSRNAMSDPTMCKWQLRYVKYFVSRMKKQKAIIGWDLGNEAECIAMDVEPDAFYVWCSSIANAIRVADPTRPVISGFGTVPLTEGNGNSHEVGEYCDIHTVHPYHFTQLKDPIHSMRPVMDIAYRTRIAEDLSGIPTFVQEFGALGYMACSYETEADFYRGAGLACMANSCHGIMYWCAFDQGHHTFTPYNWNNIGSQYGFFKADRTEKPIAEGNRYLREFANSVPNGLPKHARDCTIILPRENAKANEILRTSFLLAKQAGLDASFAYALDPIPDSPLYFFPCPTGNKAITKRRWNELLEKVQNGSRLFLTLSKGLFREIPETFGVKIDYRCERAYNGHIQIGREALPISSPYTYSVVPTTARVLATDDHGNPVLFENDYGKGKTYLSILPIEEYVGNRDGAFFDEDAPAYHKVYRLIADGVGSQKISKVDSARIFRTEHIADENTRYIFLINHSIKEERAFFSLADGWRTEVICGMGLDGETVCLRGNDGVLLRAERLEK